MPVRTAIYYPYARINSEHLLKQALLLWDRVEYLVPYKGFASSLQDPALEPAAKLIASPHVPSESEKRRVHVRVADLIKTGLPQWFYLDSDASVQRFGIMPDKFAPETWRLLEEERLATGRRSDQVTTRSMALTLLGILADTCAGRQKHLFTDEGTAYAVVNRYLAASAKADLVDTPSSQFHRLLTLSLQAIDVRGVPLKSLMRLREREDASGRRWRHNYLAFLERQVELLSRPGLSDSDRAELDRQLVQDVQDDLSRLREELASDGSKVFLVPHFLAVCGLIAAGETAAATLYSAGAAATVALWRSGVEHGAMRKRILDGHPTSWLYNMPRR